RRGLACCPAASTSSRASQSLVFHRGVLTPVSRSDRNADCGIEALREARALLGDRDMKAVVVAGLVLSLPACGAPEEPPAAGTISVFLGNGDGTLLPRRDYPAVTPRSLVV